MIAIARNGKGARLGTKGLALGLAASIVAPGLVAGCGGNNQQAAAPPMAGGRMPMNQPRMQPQNRGMTGKQKMLLLGGAALAYYLWKRNKNAQGQALPQGVQMYRSRNGGIYYRDPRNPRNVTYVVPPSSGPQAQPFNQTMQVDPADVQGLGLEGYQGYNGGRSGQGLDAVRGLIPEYTGR